MAWPSSILTDLKAYWNKYPFGPEVDRMEWARLIATLKNGLSPRKGQPFTLDEHLLTYRRPATDAEINMTIRAAFGYFSDNGQTGSPS